MRFGNISPRIISTQPIAGSESLFDAFEALGLRGPTPQMNAFKESSPAIERFRSLLDTSVIEKLLLKIISYASAAVAHALFACRVETQAS